MAFCIPAPVAERMKQAIRDGDIDIKKLYDLSTEDRRAIFEKHTSPELAKLINTNFEKAMVSKQKDALQDWVKKTFTPEEQKGDGYKNIQKKIQELDQLGVLNPVTSESYLSDLVSDKLGASVTAEEAKNISKLADKLETTYEKKDDAGIPTIEYWQARKEMDDYLNGLVPVPRLKVATSTAGRGAMLLSVKSPLTNIVGNTVQGLLQGFERRLASGQAKGLNNDYAFEYVKKVHNIFQKSGYDISRMEQIGIPQRRLGEQFTHSQGPGVVRQVGRWYQDVVFKQLMGAPDVVASSIGFADSVNLASTKVAQSEHLVGEVAKQRALEVFKDATRIDPQTPEGELVRSQALADATYATYTNDGLYSDFAMAIRNALNTATGDFRLGDQLMPFVKTPANVVQAGIESSGVTLPIDLIFKLPEAKRQLALGNKKPMQDITRHMIRAGLGFTLAAILAYSINPDDFIGEYDSLSPKEKDLVRLKNATPNSVKIGNKYVSLDYFGPLGAPFVGLLYARKYGETLPEKIFQYARGVVGQTAKVPGLRQFADLITEVQEAVQKGSLGEIAAGLTDETIAYIRSRTIPAIVNDFAKGIDPLEREVGRSQLAKTQAGIPGLREQLPPKIDLATGQLRESEGFISSILFGQRVKTAVSSPVIDEIKRLSDKGQGPTVSDITYRSTRVKALKDQIGEAKFEKAVSTYYKNFNKEAGLLIRSSRYRVINDEKKSDLLNKLRGDVLDKMLAQYGYKKPKKKHE